MFRSRVFFSRDKIQIQYENASWIIGLYPYWCLASFFKLHYLRIRRNQSVKFFQGTETICSASFTTQVYWLGQVTCPSRYCVSLDIRVTVRIYNAFWKWSREGVWRRALRRRTMVPAQTEIQDVSSERITQRRWCGNWSAERRQARRLRKEERQLTRSENSTPSSAGWCASPRRATEVARRVAATSAAWLDGCETWGSGTCRPIQPANGDNQVRRRITTKRAALPVARWKLMRMRTRLARAEAWKMQVRECPPSQWHWCATTGCTHHGCRSCGCSLAIAQ